MKIVDVSTLLLSADVPQERSYRTDYGQKKKVFCSLIYVETDEGIVGYGDAHGTPIIQKTIVEKYLRELLIGENPLKVEYLYEKMYNSTRLNLALKYGYAMPPLAGISKGETLNAISGVDIALWDICGKALNVPIYQLMGGGVREEIPAYASGGWRSAEGIGEEVASYIEKGFKSVKIRVGLGDGPPRVSAKRIENARKALKPEHKLMMDAHCTLNVALAKELASRVEEFDVYWFEEPVASDDPQGNADVRKSTYIQIATGENCKTRFEFRDLIDAGACDIFQPDISVVGGLTETMRICHLAYAYGKLIAPHVWGSAVNAAASLQMAAAAPNCIMLEVGQAWNPLFSEISNLNLEPDVNGNLAIPNKPGLGIELPPVKELKEKYKFESSISNYA